MNKRVRNHFSSLVYLYGLFVVFQHVSSECLYNSTISNTSLCLAKYQESNLLLIEYKVNSLNTTFTYHLNTTEQTELNNYINIMLKCPREKLLNMTYTHCPMANEMNPYVYVCCDYSNHFISLKYHALELKLTETLHLSRIMSQNV